MNQQIFQAVNWQQGHSCLVCVERWQETHEVTSFRFQGETPVKFHFKPGQFITFLLRINGEEVARSYTISSSPSRPYSIVVTVKRIEGGLVSNYLIDKLQVGHCVNVLGPNGCFNLVDISAEKYLFLSAGSGITPVYSMSRWLLDTQVGSDIQFVHSAKSLTDVIFQCELQQMAKRHSTFGLSYCLGNDEPSSEINSVSGRLSLEVLQQVVPDFHERTIFVCGPETYMQAVKNFLQQMGFDMSRYHQESFGAESSSTFDVVSDNSANPFMLQIGQVKVALTTEQSILEGIEELKLPIIAACRSGICGACKCKVEVGEVESSSQMALTPEEVSQGYVLACSTKLKSDIRLVL